MENIEEIYKQLTGVDIEEQRRIWDERGKGYYGEYCVFEKLFHGVHGNCKFLMNLNIPTNNGRTTEIDPLMIHESGIYVFEIKHYKGTIYGNVDDSTWTQYFRTAKNNVFNNPVLQNGYHVRALHEMFPHSPIYSVIIFTNSDCDLKISNNNPNIVITTLFKIGKTLTNLSQWKNTVYDIAGIDAIFRRLMPYSPMRNVMTVIDEKEVVPFYDYLDLLAENHSATIRSLRKKEAAMMQQLSK